MERLALAVSVILAAAGCIPGRGVVGPVYQIPVTGYLPKAVTTCAVKWVKELTTQHILPGLRNLDDVPWLMQRHGARDVRSWFSTLFKTFDLNTARPDTMGLPHRGGKDVIPNDVLDECIKDVVTTGYRNRWQAGHRDVYIQNVCKEYECTNFYLFRRMFVREPRLRWCVKLCPKMVLSEQHMADRVKYCERMKRTSLDALKAYIFVDQKKLYIAPKHAMKCWGLLGEGYQGGKAEVVRHPLLSSKKWRGAAVYYYAAVNAVLGPIGIFLTTGSQGPGALTSKFMVS
jgi:hypothetical protein